MTLANAPGGSSNKTRSAESAIHSNGFLGHHCSMPQSLRKVILHIIFTTKNREPWLDSANTAPHARLSGNDLPRFLELSIVRRRCDRSCADRHDTAASALPV